MDTRYPGSNKPLAYFYPLNHRLMSTDKYTIMYAEDDLDDLFLVQQAFEKHNHIAVVHAADGRKAMTMLEDMLQKKALPCLTILDINMPVMNGREVLQAIRSNPDLAKLTVVLFSTSNNPTDIAFANELNASLVTKPIDYFDLEKIAADFVNQCNFDINKPTLN